MFKTDYVKPYDGSNIYASNWVIWLVAVLANMGSRRKGQIEMESKGGIGPLVLS